MECFAVYWDIDVPGDHSLLWLCSSNRKALLKDMFKFTKLLTFYS